MAAAAQQKSCMVPPGRNPPRLMPAHTPHGAWCHARMLHGAWCLPTCCTAAHMLFLLRLQVVSDYLTAYDGELAYLQAANKPVVLYTYRLEMRRHADAIHVAAALQHS